MAAVSAAIGWRVVIAQGTAARFAGPTSSQTLALSADGSLLAVANPDNNSVTFFDVGADRNQRLAEVRVQAEPNGVALAPNGTRAYVANTVSGTVTVLSLTPGTSFSATTVTHIAVGAEPYSLALTPNGRKLYVANARSNNVSVIDTATNRVSRTIENVGFEPRGIAITNDGDDDDTDETVYVTLFFSLPVAGKLDGEDDGKQAFVAVLSTRDDSVTTTATLRPIADTGFKAAGDALARRAPPATPAPADFTFTTGAYPNQLNNIGIRGRFAYVPNTGASPNGPTRFDVNTQSLLSVIDLTQNREAGNALNMHTAVRDQTNTARRFITQPWAIAFKNRSDDGYVVSAASNIVVKLSVDATTGAPTVRSDPSDSTRVLQIPAGKNPRGIAINGNDTRAYVMNYISRDVSVIDLTASPERVTATLRSADLPTAGSFDEVVHIGKELYNSSIGEFEPAAPGGAPITGRLSNNGWGACSTCHPFGLTDHVVWIFAAGPRRAISQHQDFDFTNPDRQRALNWSGIFDEEEDFEANIRGVSGGLGLLVQADGTGQDAIGAFTPASSGRRQLKVRGVGAWDALKAFIQFGIRAPISPVPRNDADAAAGREIFRQNNCQLCHGGTLWTSSRIIHTPPAPGSLLSSGQLIDQLRKVGTFNSELRTEIRANATAPLGNDGYVPPSLLSVFAIPSVFLHNGTATSLEAVLDNVTHRSAGTGGVDMLGDADQRRKLARFLASIDAQTAPIFPAPLLTRVSVGGVVNAASFAASPNAAAPGSLVSIFGENLAAGRLSAVSLPLPTNLGGTQVLINNLPAPLIFISGRQINAQVPFELTAGTTANVVVKVSGQPDSSVEPVRVEAAAPGIFTLAGSGTGAGAVLHADFTPVSTTSPARPGETVLIYCTGLGLTDPRLATGEPGRAQRTVETPTVTIGGSSARVDFSGAAWGFVGLYQLNVVVPALATGDHEVIITISSRPSRAGVTIRVQPQ